MEFVVKNTDAQQTPGDSIQLLKKELRDRETEIALLKEITDAVSSEFNLEKLFQLVAKRAQGLIQAETVLIPLIDADLAQYTYRAGYGNNIVEIVGESLPLDLGICGWVWRNKRAWWRGVLDELNEEERNRWERQAGTVIMVPLIGKRRFLGGISGTNKIGGGDFSRRDLDLLTMFAHQVSIAIENAMFFDEVDKAKKAMDAYQLELKHLNQDLEKRVQKRTEALAEANEKLSHQALYDDLTKLPNRYLVQDRIQHALHAAKRDGKPLTIIMMDLDHFKEVNDTLGHHVGDLLLKEVGNRFQSAVRRSDTVGRLGGDEFAIIAPGADSVTAVVVAKKILKVLEQPFELERNKLDVSTSLGLSIYPEHGKDVSTLLRHADVAMYVAKRAHSGYCIYDPDIDTHSSTRLSLMSELRSAVHNNDLRLYYQPKIDLGSGRVVGVEALARWPHAEKGFIGPDVFIPLLEKSELIKPFTQWVLETAVRQYDEWRKSGIELTMSVNLSMYNLVDPELPGQIVSLLNAINIKRDALILELTEGAFLSDPQRVLPILNTVKSMGVQLSLDDFGTGYSSLTYLRELPVDEVKIDKSFVKNLADNKDDFVIVRAIIDLAHNLGHKVVAEGAEEISGLKILLKLGCDMAQGYYFSAPLPPEEFYAKYEKQDWLVEIPKT